MLPPKISRQIVLEWPQTNKMVEMNEEMQETTRDYCDYLIKIKGLSDRTAYHYLTYHRYFVVRPLTQENINSFIKSKNNNSVCRGYMKSYLEFLKRDREFDLPIVKTGTKKKKLIRAVSESEIKKLRGCAYKSKARDGIIIDLLYYGALRRGEILTIKVNSFDWGAFFDKPNNYGKVRVVGKGKKERFVLVHHKAIETLLGIYLDLKIITDFMQPAEIIEKLNSMDAPLFKKLSEWSVWGIVRKHSLKNLKRDIRPHELRHARATELEESGASIKDIQIYLGHSSQATTEIYLHSNEKKALDRIEKISEK